MTVEGPAAVIDTNVFGAELTRRGAAVADAYREHVEGRQLFISFVTLAELRYGAAKKASERITRQVEVVLAALDVLPLEAPADALYGMLRARLEQAGQPIGGNDLLIAAQALALGYTLVTDNEREFSRITELPLENWLR